MRRFNEKVSDNRHIPSTPRFSKWALPLNYSFLQKLRNSNAVDVRSVEEETVVLTII